MATYVIQESVCTRSRRLEMPKHKIDDLAQRCSTVCQGFHFFKFMYKEQMMRNVETFEHCEQLQPSYQPRQSASS